MQTPLESSRTITYAVARLIRYKPDRPLELWRHNCVSRESAAAQADQMNLEMQEAPDGYLSPESPFFVAKVIKEERVELAGDTP